MHKLGGAGGEGERQNSKNGSMCSAWSLKWGSIPPHRLPPGEASSILLTQPPLHSQSSTGLCRTTSHPNDSPSGRFPTSPHSPGVTDKGMNPGTLTASSPAFRGQSVL